MVGAYLPGWLLSAAAIPPWTLLLVALCDAAITLAATRIPARVLPILTAINVVGLGLYAFSATAVLFYVAFADSGIS